MPLSITLTQRMRWRLDTFHQELTAACNSFLRFVMPASVRLRYRLGFGARKGLKLHLGCGGKRLDGFINIDIRRMAATDLVCDIRRLPYPNDSAERIETYHVIEHLQRHDLPKALKEWHRLLAPGGVLVIECPDFDTSVSEYLQGRTDRLDNIFGLQRHPGDFHFFGYNAQRLRQVLEQAGFSEVRREDPTDYHSQMEPCLRLVAFKSEANRG